MSFADLLINECDIFSYSEGDPDVYGNPKKTWGDPVTKPCRLVAGPGREIKVGAEVVLSNHRLFLEEVDISERDRVEVNGQNYEIVLVSEKQDSFGVKHLECDLVTVK